MFGKIHINLLHIYGIVFYLKFLRCGGIIILKIRIKGICRTKSNQNFVFVSKS